MSILPPHRPNNLVQSIERVAMLFDVLAQSSQGISLRELSAKTKLPKGTAHRLLSSLAYYGYIRQTPETKNYHLGFRLVELGNSLLNQLDIRFQAKSYLNDLCDRIKETVHLVILDQYEALYIDKVEPSTKQGGLQMVSRVGFRISAHCSSVGKVLLAQFSETELDNVIKLKGLPKKTKNTITDSANLKTHLKMVRSQGFAIDDEENEEGIRCVAAPVFNQQGQVFAAISISGPTVRITKKLLQTYLKKEIIKTASAISKELGYQGAGSMSQNIIE